MKPTACVRCRQWKVRCDAIENGPQGCTRCKSLNVPCVTDGNFKRVSKSQKLLEMQAEIDRLRQVVHADSSPQPGIPTPGQDKDQEHVLTPKIRNRPQQHPAVQLLTSPSDAISSVGFVDSMPRVGPTVSLPPTVIGQDRVLGDIRLMTGQAADLFQIYLTQLHPYLPFIIDPSIDSIYLKCPLLFWVICAVATSNPFKAQFKPHITSMISGVLSATTKSVEMVQALLIMCMWPFPFSSLADDPSHFYSGLATQLGLQMGLHRSMMTSTHEHGSEKPENDADQGTRLTTWLACFVVNQMQASYRGVPPSILTDFVLLSSFNHVKVDLTLSRLCHIAALSAQSTLAIGANAPNFSGLLDEPSRTSLIKLFGVQFSMLRLQHLSSGTSDIEQLAFLNARLHLWSFALLDDVACSGAQYEILQQAEDDALALMDLECAKNLSTAPYHVARALIYSGLILIKIIRSPYTTSHERLLGYIEHARLRLGAAVSIENDILAKACTVLQQLPLYHDQRLTPRIVSRLSASLVYDSLRVYCENQKGGVAPSVRGLDLDGFDWNSLQL